MFLVGLTGGIGSGKSTVAWLLAGLGAVVIDADEIARQVVEPGKPAWRKIVEHFGQDVLTAEGTIDRPKLASIVFNDPSRLALLNEITHPPIMEEIASHLEAYRGTDSVVVLDAPLLVEAGGAAMVDFLVVVGASRDTQLERLARDRGMDSEAALARIRNQATMEQRAAAADYLIVNDGPMRDLEAKVELLWQEIQARRDGSGPKRSGGADPGVL